MLVPFGNRTLEAIAIERVSTTELKVLKPIDSLIAPFPLLSKEVLDLMFDCAKRWAAHPYDLIRSAVPPRAPSAERGVVLNTNQVTSDKKSARSVYYQFSPGEDEFHSLCAMAIKASKTGGVLVLVPDERDVDAFLTSLKNNYEDAKVARLDSALTRTQRYAEYLSVAAGEVQIVVGTRSAVFAPIHNLQTIFIHRETSESFYEVRTPGWNARDVALMRCANEGIAIVVSGYSPSAEIARLIENKYISVSLKKEKLNATAFTQQMGELLPNRIFPEIREALRNGAVLFLAPRKGYAAAMTCSKCRNEARCSCGGKLFKKSARSAPQCSLCSKGYVPWKCTWCNGDKPHLLGRGSERFAQELGRAFPNIPIVSSEGEHILEEVAARSSMVIATPGAVPKVHGGYSAVVVLEANRYFAQVDLRAHERARAQIFHAASRVSPKGKVLLVIDSTNPITASLARWSPSILSMRDLKEREEAEFPPYFRAVEILAERDEAILFANGFKKSILEGRLPASTKVLGPAFIADDNAKIILLANLSDSPQLVEFIHEFARKRSVAKKSALKYRVDPYALT
jgi:primosomal protein N' (replication factor Y)